MKRTKEISAILLSFILLIGLVPAMPVLAAAAGDAQTGAASGDNSLSSLSLSAGSLSPAFQYNVTDYTASVGAEVSSVEVNAQTSNANATVESVSGNTDLQPGQNTISVVVKAENGVTATYKIVVTRAQGAEGNQDEGAGEVRDEGTDAPLTEDGTQQGNQEEGITVNGHPFNLAAAIPDDVIPQDFTKTTITCQGQQVEGLQYEKGALSLVYLTTPSTEVKNTLAVYEEASGTFYPFRKITQGESNYLILLNPPAETGLSQEYNQGIKKIDVYEDVPVFTRAGTASESGESAEGLPGAEEGQGAADGSEFALVYAVSSFGNTGWYQYDAAEATFQRYQQAANTVQTGGEEEPEEGPSVEMQGLQNAYKDLEENYNKKTDVSRKTTAVLIFMIAALLIVIINLLLRGRRGGDDFEEYEEPEEGLRRQPHRKQELIKEPLTSLRKKNREEKEAEDIKTHRSVHREDEFREGSKDYRKMHREDKFREEPVNNRRIRREDELKEESVNSRKMRREDELRKEPLEYKRTRREEEVRKEPKNYRKTRWESGDREEVKSKPVTKLEDFDDDFEVIDLEDL
ncbi:hypothetical protein D3Z36_10720 [Lachnospiraceae bacterium]|nr:hypothetical protein [Lachnospiraceae bacterium]